MKWRVKQESVACGNYVLGMPRSIRERKWLDITATAEEECTIQVELNRTCSFSGKVCMYIMSTKGCSYLHRGRYCMAGKFGTGDFI